MKYDLIVIGLGHAGAEAAHAAATMGLIVLGIDPNKGYVRMPCSNSIGGVGKGQLVREVDALGGMTGRVSDLSTLQFRMLNFSKGAAMWSPRSQNDRSLYAQAWQHKLMVRPHLYFLETMVTSLHIEQNKIKGVITKEGERITAKAVILTTGTFLNGMMHIGKKQEKGGRAGEKASYGITEQLRKEGFEVGRLKTGTSPRVDGRSLRYDVLESQRGDEQPIGFSFWKSGALLHKTQICSHIAHTNEEVHEIIRKGLKSSPLYTGQITSKGPRYCPSFETKVTRFSDKLSHSIFIQPEGWHTPEVYLNGFSTSLPASLQEKALRQIKGFESVQITRMGYAIEYDYVLPTQLSLSLEALLLPNLFLAGQVNGTTGYEEAAAQGIMAGINAALKIKGEEPFIIRREEGYIGVLIYDLVNKGVDEEPYRIRTSSNEYRISSHQGNADTRLTPYGHRLGLLSNEQYEKCLQKEKNIADYIAILQQETLSLTASNNYLARKGTSSLREKQSIFQLVKRPEVNLKELINIARKEGTLLPCYSNNFYNQVGLAIKYAPYIKKELSMAKRVAALEQCPIPPHIDYNTIKGISTEGKEKLNKYGPTTLGEASQISGISPSDVTILLLYLTALSQQPKGKL